MFSVENSWECDNGQTKLNAKLFSGNYIGTSKKQDSFSHEAYIVTSNKAKPLKNNKRKCDANKTVLHKLKHKKKKKKSDSTVSQNKKEDTSSSLDSQSVEISQSLEDDSTNTNVEKKKKIFVNINKHVTKLVNENEKSKVNHSFVKMNGGKIEKKKLSQTINQSEKKLKNKKEDFNLTQKLSKEIKANVNINKLIRNDNLSKNKLKDNYDTSMMTTHVNEIEPCVSTLKTTPKYNKFQAKLNRKLDGGHFRWINEQLYTNHSSSAVKLFKSNYELFDLYHKGFSSQVKQWPQNPVDLIIKYILERNKDLIVCDFGCGDAKIAASVPNVVHSFDLVAVNNRVVACDMKKVPLKNESVDISVFCLSLMGTNLEDFIVEANRVLKHGGILKIAEVKSRCQNIDFFADNICAAGFKLISKDDSNKMFVMIEFEKTASRPSRNLVIKLNPCIYKKR